MDCEKAYKETLAQYYILNVEIQGFKREDEKFDIIFEFANLIGEYETKLIEMQIKNANQKEIDRLKSFIFRLMKIYNSYGLFYYHEKINARKLLKTEKELLELQMAVADLQKENEILKKQLDF